MIRLHAVDMGSLKGPDLLLDVLKRRSQIESQSQSHLSSFRTRPDDIIIVGYPKSGSTWMQQIVHGLRTNGSMDFEEICRVVPFLERTFLETMPVSDDLYQQASMPFRAFKCHCPYSLCPKGAKYIVVSRDPKDVAISYFRFLEGWFFKEGELSADEFVLDVWLRLNKQDYYYLPGSHCYWDYFASWWPHVDDPNVLWLYYEDMKEDIVQAVKTVGEFIGCPTDDATYLEKVVNQASIDFMKKHADQFEARKSVREPLNASLGIPLDQKGTGYVHEGTIGSHKARLSEDSLKAIDEKWKEIEEIVGYPSYAEVRKGFQLKNRKKGCKIVERRPRASDRATVKLLY